MAASRFRRFLSFVTLASAVVVAGLLVPNVNHAQTRYLTAITVTPADPAIGMGQTETFSGQGTFDDLSTQLLSAGGGTWVPSGSLTTARFYHTATLLQDGSVLVVGGYNGSPLATAERYSPSTNTWSFVPSMSAPRAAHTATLLPNGTVLVVGGVTFANNGVYNSTEIYDPATNSWSAGPDLSVGVRGFHSAMLLNTGKVLVVAGVMGWPDCTYRTTAELYTPGTPGSWAQTGSLHLARSNASTVLLTSGQVLLAGGPASNCPTPNVGMNQAEIYNPVTGAWTVTGNTTVNRYNNFIAALPNGNALLAGGVANNITPSYRATSEVFSAADGTFGNSGSLASARATSGGTGDNGTTVVLENGDVLVAGGNGTSGVLSSAELYTYTTGLWTPTGSMATGRSHNTTTLLQDGRVLVVGGSNASGVALSSAEIYTPKVSWSSSNSAVATIDQSGVATGLSAGTTTIAFTSGGITGSTTLTVAVDTEPPTTNATFAAANANGWHRFNVDVALDAFDPGGVVPASGVQSITYGLTGAQTGGGTLNTTSTLFTISNEGTTTVTYYATDANGNVESTQTLTINLDKTAPSLAALPNIAVSATSSAGAIVTFTPAALDLLSGIDMVAVTQGFASGATFPHGTTSEQVTVTDRAGNSTSRSFSVTVNTTLVSIAVSPSTATLTTNHGSEQFTATGTFTDDSTQVLVSGGGAWAPSGSLATPRFYHTATLLPDGSVLVAGGYNFSSNFASAERYYPGSGTWVPAGSMALERNSHTATLLPNGKVLVVGGIRYVGTGGTLTNTTELYDPSTNSWSAGPPLTLGVRSNHSAVLLATGKVLVTAGLLSYPDCTYRPTSELYDPALNIWTATGSLSLRRSSATATLLGNGKVLLAGGPQNGCPTPNNGLNEAEVYDPASGAWTVTGTLSLPRYNNSITLLQSGKVLLAGGYTASGTIATADLYDPNTGSFSLTGSMATARATTGGAGDNGTSPLLQNGQVLFAGGYTSAGPILANTELYNPASGTWTTTGSLVTARAFGTATLLADGRVLAVGGYTNGAIPLGSAELYVPPGLTWASSNGSVSMDQSGAASGISTGTATITATFGSISGSASVTVDKTAPTTTATPSPAPNGAGWNNTDVAVMLNATDNVGGTGVQSVIYSLNGVQSGGPFSSAGNVASAALSVEGTTTLHYHAVDNGGSAESAHPLSIMIDKTPPSVFYPQQGVQANATSPAGAVVSFSVSASDSLSGVVGGTTISTMFNGSPVIPALVSGSTFPVGTTTQTVTATDAAGNVRTASFNVVVGPYDSTAPTTTANFQPPNANGWHRFNVFVSLNAFDSGGSTSPSGVSSITYSLSGAQSGGGTFNTSNTSFTISSEGTTTVTYHATDQNGNLEPDHTLMIKLDKTPPSAASLPNLTVQATSSAGAVVLFDAAPSDALSGISSVFVTQGLPSGSTFPHGTTSERLTITDGAGNTATRSFSVTVNKTLLSIAVSPLTASVTVDHDTSFQATGHFTSGSDQILPTGGGGGGSGGGSGPGGSGGGSAPSVGFWNIHFTPGLDVSACGGVGEGVGFSSQAFSVNSNGVINTTQWSPMSPTVNVTGQVTANVQVTLTISCIGNPAISTTVNLPWQTTSFDGAITFSGQTTNAHVTGWSSQPSMPTPAFASGAATIDNKLYVVGGSIDGAPSGLVQVFDFTTRTWMAPAASMSPREGPAVAALNGYIYAAGGHMSGGDATNTLQRFDPAANQWVTLAPMLAARAELQLVAANGMLYAIGGEAGNGNQPPIAAVERYDPVANEWVARAPMSSPRKFFAAGALNNETTIIVAGGSGSVELYNIGTNTWSATSPLQVSMAAGATIANRFYVATQCGSFVYRPADGTLNEGWAIMPNMLNPRGEFAVAVSGDVMYAAGGFTGSNPSSPLATFDALSTPPPSDLAYNQSGASCSGGGGGGGGGSSLPTVEWSTSDSSIAGINSFGQATGHSPGQATIIATAAGVSCATTNTCATLTVTPAAHLTFVLGPGSAVFASVGVTIIDPSTGEVVDGPFDVPFGETQSIDEFNPFRLGFAAPAGYTVTPATVDFTLSAGDNVTVPLLFALIDTTPPVLTLPLSQTMEATGPAGAVITFASATATDLGSGVQSVSCDRASGETFPLGTTTVHCQATDNNGNSAPGSFNLTVVDTTPPTLSLPAHIIVDAVSPSGVVVTYTTSASDLVSVALAVNCGLASGSMFPIGTSTVNCAATDGAGNPASGSFTVLVQAAAAQVANLGILVQDFNLVQGIANSLDAKLQNILAALDAAQSGSAANVCGQLGAFINETQAQSGKKLTVAQADQLILAATRIKAVVGCAAG